VAGCLQVLVNPLLAARVRGQVADRGALSVDRDSQNTTRKIEVVARVSAIIELRERLQRFSDLGPADAVPGPERPVSIDAPFEPACDGPDRPRAVAILLHELDLPAARQRVLERIERSRFAVRQQYAAGDE
jgi:hypothetical protein